MGVAGTRVYEGRRTATGCEVTVDGKPLDPRFDLLRLSDGFEWGYDGNGPRQLPFALLADLLGDDARAEELAQEAMLTVWRKAHLYDPRKAAPATWIFCIARNIRIDALRREHRLDVDPDDPLFVADPEPAPDASFEAGQREERVRRALAGLPADQVRVLELSFFQGKAHGEIAVELRLPLGTVKSRLRLAFGRLRAVLEGQV